MEFKAEEIQQQHEEEEEEEEEQREEEEEGEAEEENQRGGGEEEEEEEEHFHVLAVDDSSIDRKILEKLLTGSSYQVTCVESGDKALEYLGLLDSPPDPIRHDSLAPSSSSTAAAADASTTTTSSSSGSSHQQANGMRVNLIMTDYSMPGMSGYDLLKRVKGSSWKDVPVIVMSSENVPSRIDMCMEGGAEEFLLKPVQMADLKRLQPHLLKNSSSYGKRKAPMSKHSDRRIKFELEGLAV